MGDMLQFCKLHLCDDTNIAGHPTKNPTGGLLLVIGGPFTKFPLNGQSKRQACLKPSTPAEVVAADFVIRREGLPALDLWDVIRQADL